MKLISHRGNLEGPNPERENHPDYIYEAIQAGYDVEIDIWFVDGKFKLGHDEPQYDFPFDLFSNFYTFFLYYSTEDYHLPSKNNCLFPNSSQNFYKEEGR